jgi:polysaccharide chain length determinant protein (PEP-CTERM system associated)
VLTVFVVVTAGTIVVTSRMPDLYKSDTLILVDPQRVPESYVKATVTGDIRSRLSTLSQQILSVTRLQKIIDALNLYPTEKKTLAREDVIALMRRHISVGTESSFGASQDLQAFRIGFSGEDPRLVAQVANELASLFIEENLKAREQQATGTTEFLQNQLLETRKSLEAQEAKLKDFRLKHLGEMPEQQSADLQILGQLQSQFQLEGEALARAEQQRSMMQTMLSQTSVPVIDLDGNEQPKSMKGEPKPVGSPSVSPARAQLAALLAKGYTEKHPTVRKLMAEISAEEAAQQEPAAKEATPPVPVSAAASPESTAPTQPVSKPVPPLVATNNPVLQSQIRQVDAEIAKHKQELQRLNKQIAGYQSRLEAIPVREQQITELVRDYEMSKAHYSQLLDNQLSAETATQLEIRQKGEKFSILDPAQPAERPYSPKRGLIDAGGSVAGLALGLLLALVSEVMGMSITTTQQITESTGVPVLEVIPVIETFQDRMIRRRRIVWAAVSGVLAVGLASFAAFYHYRS